MLRASGDGPYAKQAATVSAVLRSGSDSPLRSSPPEVVAGAVAKAVTARRPKTRYAVGAGARPILAARRVLPDRAFDRVMALVYWVAVR